MPLDCLTIEKVLDKMFLPDYLDLHSISFYDLQLLKLIKKTKIPLILALGGRTGDELIEKIDYFGNQIYCIMVGFQSFPTKFDDIIIEKINTLKSLYGEIHIGYADHSQYDDSSMIVNNEYALKLGATVFEKHITIEEGIERIDYISAINKNKFSKLVDILKKSKTADYKFLDIDLDYLAPSEIKYRNREKYAVAAKKLNKGEVINCNNISYKLIDKGLVGYNQNDAIPNLKLNTDVEYDDIILQEHFI
jgi:Sialic acid synthase